MFVIPASDSATPLSAGVDGRDAQPMDESETLL